MARHEEFTEIEMLAAIKVPYGEYVQDLRTKSPEEQDRARRLLRQATAWAIETALGDTLPEADEQSLPKRGYLVPGTDENGKSQIYQLVAPSMSNDADKAGAYDVIDTDKEEDRERLRQANEEGFTERIMWPDGTE
jgi:hypothetical protein